MKFAQKIFIIFKTLVLVFLFLPKLYGAEEKPFWKKFYLTTGIEAYRYYKDTSNLVPKHSETAPFLFGIGYDINKNHSFSINFMDFDFFVEYSSAPMGGLFNETITEKHQLRNIDLTYTYYFFDSPRGRFMLIDILTIENHTIGINVDVFGAFYSNNFNGSFTAKNNMLKTGAGYRFFINKYMELNLYYLLGIYQKVDDKNYDNLRALGAKIPEFERFNHFIEVNLIWHF